MKDLNDETIRGLLQAIEEGNLYKVQEILKNQTGILALKEHGEDLAYAAEKTYREYFINNSEKVIKDSETNDHLHRPLTETTTRAAISALIFKTISTSLGDFIDIPIFNAIINFDIEAIKNYLSETQNLNIIDYSGISCLSKAVLRACTTSNPSEHEKAVEIIKLLLEKGADPNFSFNKTPLHIAVSHNNQEIVDLLFKYNANANYPSSNTSPTYVRKLSLPLQDAQDENMLQLLFKNGANLNNLYFNNKILSNYLDHFYKIKKENIERESPEKLVKEQKLFNIIDLLLKNSPKDHFVQMDLLDNYILKSKELKYIDVNMVKLLLGHGVDPKDSSFEGKNWINDEIKLKEFCVKKLEKFSTQSLPPILVTSENSAQTPIVNQNIEISQKKYSFFASIIDNIINFFKRLFFSNNENYNDNEINSHKKEQSQNIENSLPPIQRFPNSLKQKDRYK